MTVVAAEAIVFGKPQKSASSTSMSAKKLMYFRSFVRILSVTAATFGRVDSSHVTSALCAVQLAYTSSKGAVLAMTRELSVIHAR